MKSEKKFDLFNSLNYKFLTNRYNKPYLNEDPLVNRFHESLVILVQGGTIYIIPILFHSFLIRLAFYSLNIEMHKLHRRMTFKWKDKYIKINIYFFYWINTISPWTPLKYIINIFLVSRRHSCNRLIDNITIVALLCNITKVISCQGH